MTISRLQRFEPLVSEGHPTIGFKTGPVFFMLPDPFGHYVLTEEVAELESENAGLRHALLLAQQQLVALRSKG